MFAGGVSKRRLGRPSRGGIEAMIVETRRAELTHWFPVVLSLTFFAWNPFSVAIWMPLVGFLGNAPFIVVQRYLRPRFTRFLNRRLGNRSELDDEGAS